MIFYLNYLIHFIYLLEKLGLGPVGLSKLILNEQVSEIINSYPGPNVDVLDRLLSGKIRLEVMPQVIITY